MFQIIAFLGAHIKDASFANVSICFIRLQQAADKDITAGLRNPKPLRPEP